MVAPDAPEDRLNRAKTAESRREGFSFISPAVANGRAHVSSNDSAMRSALDRDTVRAASRLLIGALAIVGVLAVVTLCRGSTGWSRSPP
jgi:hypothetical protein